MSNTWEELYKRIQFITRHSAEYIEDRPGVYAWFLPLYLYSEELDTFLTDAQDVIGYDRFVSDQGDVRGELRFNWETYPIRATRKLRSDVSSSMKKSWEDMTNNESLKKTFSNILMLSTILTQPLYVGKANNLRSRYEQHVSGSPGNNFNSRLTEHLKRQESSVRIEIKDLLFVAIPITSSEEQVLENNDLNELLERLLHRLCRPPYSMQ